MTRFARTLVALLSFFTVFFALRTARADGTCMIERAIGFSDSDVEAVEDLVCAEVRQLSPEKRGAYASYKIRLSKLGGKVVITLTGDRNGTRVERQLVLSSVDEVTVAASRLVEALVGAQTVAETQTVTNVVGEETRTPKKKSSDVHFFMGVIGVAAPGAAAHAGAHMALSAGNETWSFLADVRLTGNSFLGPARIFSLGIVKPDLNAELSTAALTVGTRYHLNASEHAPFVGAGLGWEHIAVKTDHEQKNSGLAGYGEIGMDFLRASRIGGALALRVESPAFTVQGKKAGDGPGVSSVGPPTQVATKAYYPIIGASFSLRF